MRDEHFNTHFLISELHDRRFEDYHYEECDNSTLAFYSTAIPKTNIVNPEGRRDGTATQRTKPIARTTSCLKWSRMPSVNACDDCEDSEK